MNQNNRGRTNGLPPHISKAFSGPDPNPDNSDSPFERLADEYDAWFDGEGRLIFQIETCGFQEILPSLPEPWIEIGVGSGRFAAALGIDTGLEPSRNLGRMSQLRGIKVTRARGEDRVFPQRSFGTAFIIVTLCFLDDPSLVLRRTWEMLKDPGKLVLGLITRESPWARFYLRKKKEGHPFYSVARFYSYVEVLGLLREAGFSHERTISTLFQAPGQVEHMELPREGFLPYAGFLIMVAGKLP
jgi:SAM-dependent methyltransferase